MKARWWACILVMAGSISAAATRTPEAGGCPFETLEADLRAASAQIAGAWTRAEADDRPLKEAALRSALEGLHDIRHHAAFGDLWDRWSFPGERIEVLYPASGAHLAPLEFVHRGRLREAIYTYTEIDPAMIPRLEAVLRRLSDLGFYQDLASAIVPLPLKPGDKGLPAPAAGDPERVRAWVRKSIEATGAAPPMEVSFAFRYRETRVLLRLLLKAWSAHPGSTEYYRGEDLAKADLVVTHDLSFDPREHLAFLRSCVESACALGRRRPLAVMMEDLSRHPARMDLSPFGIRAETRLPYGHAAFVLLPDGSRTETEDGPPLYEGGVLLEPDLAAWRMLAASQRTALFNLVLFRDHGFDRRNVDLSGGRRVEAPPILDWHTGYGHRDIEGRDLRGRRGFLSDLADSGLAAIQILPAGPLRDWLCASLAGFRSTLAGIASRNGPAAAREAAGAPPDHPFLLTPESRRQFRAAAASAEAVGRTLSDDAAEAGAAAPKLSPVRLERAGCTPAPAPSRAGQEARP